MSKQWKRRWRYGRAMIIPILLWGLVAVTLWVPLKAWLEGSESNDRDTLREWLIETRGFRDTLPAMIDKYIEKSQQVSSPIQENALLSLDRLKIETHLESLCEPISRMYSNQLPLFPLVYRITIIFDKQVGLPAITWDSQVPHDDSQRKKLTQRLGEHAVVELYYQLHAFDKRQREKELRAIRARNLLLLAVVATGLALGWVIYVQQRESERDRQRMEAKQEIDEKERLLLEEEIRRQEAERQREEAELDLLQQRLAAQTSERKLLEVKSQLLASIGIMAGSYAHNIKNLLVRPNDLLQRCLAGNGLSSEQATMLGEVKQTMGTVTERLQQILKTVRRDPEKSEPTLLDISELLRDLEHTWKEMAWDKWKLNLHVDLPDEPLMIYGDQSHLQQAVENLMFNARDATFDMRNHLRSEARAQNESNAAARQQAILEAVGWKGDVKLSAWREGNDVLIQVEDNGIGMTADVLKSCTETHFSTKRNDATFEGHGAGMGLGLSFVQVILEHHSATMEIIARPGEGATFRLRFPPRAAEEKPNRSNFAPQGTGTGDEDSRE